MNCRIPRMIDALTENTFSEFEENLDSKICYGVSRCLFLQTPMAGFVMKVLVLSVGLAIATKYGGPLLSIPASDTSAIVAVWLPSLLMAAILGWRWQKQRK